MLLLVVFNSNRFLQIQFWIWQRYETRGNKSNKVKFIVIVLKLVIHSPFFFFFWLNCVLLRYFRTHSFHQDLPKFCINKLFNLCLRYLLGRLWHPGEIRGKEGGRSLMWPKWIGAVHQGMVFAIFPEQSASLGDTQSIWVKPAPQTKLYSG